MKIALLYIFSLVLTATVTGQNNTSLYAVKDKYLLVDTFVTDAKYFIISDDKIESMTVLKDGNLVASYGENAKNGTIVIKTKPNSKLLQINDILAKYKISETDRKLRVCINKTMIDKPGLILIDADEILDVVITIDKLWMSPEDANSNERFINISTSSRNG